MARDYVEIIHSPQLPWQHRSVLPPEFAAAGAQPAVDPLEY